MSEGKSATGRMLLVVDDEALIRWSLKERLTAAGYEVVEAPDGASALDCFVRDGLPVDLALLDLKLPDTNGLSLLKNIRRLSPGCRAILMTAFGTPENVQQALAYGAYCVVGKPFNLEDLVELIGKALEAST